MASDTKTSSYSLTDRALWDLTPPGTRLGPPHPAVGKPWAERIWNRREATCSGKEANEIAALVLQEAWSFLEILGYRYQDLEEVLDASPQPQVKKKASLSRFNADDKVEWLDLSFYGLRLFLAEFSDGVWALAVEGSGSLTELQAKGLSTANFGDLKHGASTCWVRPIPMIQAQADKLKAAMDADMEWLPVRLAEAGFVSSANEDGSDIYTRPHGWFGDREIQSIFPAATRRAVPLAECAASLPMPAPFKTVLVEHIPSDGSGLTKQVSAVALEPAAPSEDIGGPVQIEPALDAHEALLLVQIAATLHAGDLRATGVQPKSIKTFLTRLLEAANPKTAQQKAAEKKAAKKKAESQTETVPTAPAPAIPDPETPIGSVDRTLLERYVAARRAYEIAQEDYESEVGAVALKWLAAALFEARCRAEGLPPDLVEEPFHPWAGLLPTDLEEGRLLELSMHRRVRAIEQEVCALAQTLHLGLMAHHGPGLDMKKFSSVVETVDIPSLVSTALAAITKGDSDKWLIGSMTANVRLAWDCLAIWLEVRPGDWPSPEPEQPFGKFLRLVHEVTNSVVNVAVVNDDGDEGDMVAGKKRSASKALVSFLEQEEYRGLPPVSVIDPVSAPDGRFMQYLRPPALHGKSLAGPTLWRQRYKRSKATTRN